MEVNQGDNRFAEVDKPYTSLGNGWMAKAGKWPLYALTGAIILVLVLAVVALISKTGHKDDAESAVKAVSSLEAGLAMLGARVDKLQDGLEQIDAKINAFDENAKTISALSERIRSLSLEIKRLASVKAEASLKRRVARRQKAKNGGHDGFHIVKKGETLYRIAKNYRISLSRLIAENHLTPKSVIHPGDRLKVGR